MLLNLLRVQLIQRSKRLLEIRKQGITPTLGKVLAHNHPKHLHLLGMRRHRVRRHNPPALPQLVRNGEFIVLLAEILVDAARNKRQALAAALAHDDKAHAFEVGGEVIRDACQIEHDAAVPALAEADELVVLADDLGGAAGEVEGEGRLIRAEVVDGEDEFLRQVRRVAPDYPADAGVHEPVFVA